MTQAVLSLNAGSSSIKFGLYRLSDAGVPIHAAGGKIEGIGTAPRLTAHTDEGAAAFAQDWPAGEALSHEDLLGDLFAWVSRYLGAYELVAIGHRVVHGGSGFFAPVTVDDPVLETLEALSALAPLHQPHNLAGVRAARLLAPHVAQVACFDTAFHHDCPEVATRFPLPRQWHDRGIRRYGFHGLSYDYIARRLAVLEPGTLGGRAIVAHLGSGASLCAMNRGRSVDTTMGFTALDGLMMGTRSGSIDPGVVLHLIAREGLDTAEVEDVLYHRSGLLGVSGVSSDMRVLHMQDTSEAREAVALFAYRAAREAAGLLASLGRLDTVVFTAGIGENDAAVRAAICARLAFAGVALDPALNEAHADVISAAGSAVTIRVIPTDEEYMIAQYAAAHALGNAA
jgi:acetate kinase